jgi:hypothetical protein
MSRIILGGAIGQMALFLLKWPLNFMLKGHLYNGRYSQIIEMLLQWNDFQLNGPLSQIAKMIPEMLVQFSKFLLWIQVATTFNKHYFPKHLKRVFERVKNVKKIQHCRDVN